MNLQKLRQLLDQEIPMGRAMEVQVVICQPERVKLAAPLKANKNHHQTAFGGSIYSLMVLSCWSWLATHLEQENIKADIVLASSEASYFKPIRFDFSSECTGPLPKEWEYFLKTLNHKKRARIYLTAHIQQDSQVYANLKAAFVAQK